MYVHRALAYQAIHPYEVGKMMPAMSRGIVSWRWWVTACTGKTVTVALVTRIEPTALTTHHR